MKAAVIGAGLLLAGSACTEAPTEGTPAEPILVATVPVPPEPGIHDTFVRDGIAFLAVWNTGVTILDVGSGMRGGLPASPVEIATFAPSPAPLATPRIHSAWWFHNPVRNEKRYLFLSQEGVPGGVGDIKVLDVADLAHPREVAYYHLAGVGPHNFWMDEPHQILYAAYYGAGVVALDVSGTLQGDLGGRELARVQVGGPGNTFVWGVMLASGRLYASDMLSGLWQLDPGTLIPVAGGNNVPERFGSELWVGKDYGYTGTWNNRVGVTVGNVIKIWSLSRSGAPTLADSIVIEGITAVTDVEVSDDGKLLMASTEGLTRQGIFWFRLENPRRPRLVGQVLVQNGIHTASFARIGGKLYGFAARNPPDPALEIYDLSKL